MSGKKSFLSCHVPGSIPVSHILTNTFTGVMNISYGQYKSFRPRQTFPPSITCFGSAEHHQVNSLWCGLGRWFHCHNRQVMKNIVSDRMIISHNHHKSFRRIEVFLPSLTSFGSAEHHQEKSFGSVHIGG